MHKLFDVCSAFGEKAATFSTLQKNLTISNQVFDPQLQAANVEEQENSESNIDRIDDKISWPPSDVENTRAENDLNPLRKKIKLSRKTA